VYDDDDDDDDDNAIVQSRTLKQSVYASSYPTHFFEGDIEISVNTFAAKCSIACKL